MDPSSAQHHQEMSSQTLESMLACTKAQQEKKPRPPEQALKCPRCDSTNTKFCYYNNYSLTQPRYFCKSCRRYWTKGGTLRNVPVGGGCRKNKRPSSSSSSRRSQDQPLITTTTTTHNSPLSTFSPLSYDSTDLSLAFARLQNQTSGQLGFGDQYDMSMLGNPSNTHFDVNTSAATNHGHGHGFLDALRSGFFENPNGFHNNAASYYGNIGNGELGLDNLGINVSEEMAIGAYDNGPTTTAVTVTTVKQEAENTRVLWGYPWQLGGDGNMGDVDSGRQLSWNNGIGPSWHGLLNSPLM